MEIEQWRTVDDPLGISNEEDHISIFQSGPISASPSEEAHVLAETARPALHMPGHAILIVFSW
jgi:hypothetical protein